MHVTLHPCASRDDVLRKIESAVHSAAKRHSGFLDRRLTLA